jgi:hypothetical protein
MLRVSARPCYDHVCEHSDHIARTDDGTAVQQPIASRIH